MSLETVHTELAPAAIGPYSQGVVANGFLFTAGQIALDPATGQVAEGGVSVQTERVFANLAAVLDTVGAGDAFLAITLLGESLGWPIDTAAARAAEFAAAICTHRGAVTSNLSFYETWRTQWHLPLRPQPKLPK